MTESHIEQGKSWVMEVFEQVREEYREQVPIDKVFPWRGGETFEDSREDQVPNGFLTYYLPFEGQQDTQHIAFTSSELAACWHPDNSEPRLEIKKRILETFKALASEEQ
jgi:hypothetical protein